MPPVALSRILADFWLEGVGVPVQTLADRPRKKIEHSNSRSLYISQNYFKLIVPEKKSNTKNLGLHTYSVSKK